MWEKFNFKKQIILMLLILLILQSSSIVLSEEDYPLRQSLDLKFTVSSSVDITKTSSSSSLENVKVKINYIIKNSTNQKIISLSTNPLAKEDNGFVFSWNNPSANTLNFGLISEIITNNEITKVYDKPSFPITEYSSDVYAYTKPTDMIDINDDIKKLALELSNGEDDEYKVVFNFAVWTKENIKYDLTSAGADAVEKSSWVLKNRVGVCDELTNLFISLCRSVGIPARFVTGISYTNSKEFSNPWGPHGWAEVYFPNIGWVPVDATYGEIGFVDAGHIKLKDTFDSNKSSSEYEWLGRNIDITPQKVELDVEVLKKGALSDDVANIGIQIYNENVGFGSYNYIETTLENKYDYYVTTDVHLSVPLEIELLSDKDVPILLTPREKKSVYFIIKIPDDLKANYKYTYPVSITTQKNYTINSEFKSENNKEIYDYETIKTIVFENEKNNLKDTSVLFYCQVEKREININENSNILCTLQNKRDYDLKNINVCILDECKKMDVLKNGENRVNFEKSFTESGSKVLVFNAKNNEITKSSYLTFMVLDRPIINISELEYPKSVGFKDSFTVNFKISKESYAMPQNIIVSVYHNENKESWDIKDINGIIPFAIELRGEYLKAGENDIRVSIEYKDEKGKLYTTEEDFKISLDNLTFSEKIRVYLNQFSLWIDRKIKR